MEERGLPRRTLFAKEFVTGLRRRQVPLEGFGADVRFGASTLQNWASGKTLPNGPQLKYICDTLRLEFQRASVRLALDKLERRFGPILWEVIDGVILRPKPHQEVSPTARGRRWAQRKA